MAATNRSTMLRVKWFPWKIDMVDASGWQDGSEPSSLSIRSKIIHATIHNHSAELLQDILRRGWDVNEVLEMPHFEIGSRYSKFPGTALTQAVKHWAEGVGILLNAESDCNLIPDSLSPLSQVLSMGVPSTDQRKIIRQLLECGANPNIQSETSKHPLILAIENNYGVEVVELLLQHGANPNMESSTNPVVRISPLTSVMDSIIPEITKKMHDHDAIENDDDGDDEEEEEEEDEDDDDDDFTTDTINSHIALFKTLLEHGADINWNVPKTQPLLHQMVIAESANLFYAESKPVFFPELLGLFYQYGGDIDSRYSGDEVHNRFGVSALEHAVSEGGYSNTIRWLLRHGANTSYLQFNHLKKHFTPFTIRPQITINQPVDAREWLYIPRLTINETPLVLLWAGMRMSERVRMLLAEMERVIQSFHKEASNTIPDHCLNQVEALWLKIGMAEDEQNGDKFAHQFGKIEACYRKIHGYNPNRYLRQIEAMWIQLQQAGCRQSPPKHSLPPEDRIHQMADLQEFSDESLHVYQEDERVKNQKDQWQYSLYMIRKTLEFLSEPRTLQWSCRSCVRENLVSLSPCVVKKLAVPALLKRYILCHDI